MTEPVVEPTPENQPPSPPVASNEGLTEAEITKIVGDAVDTKLAPIASKLEGLDLEKFKGELLGSVGEMFNSNKGQPVDEAGLLTKVGAMFDEKLSRIPGAPKQPRKSGPLGRWIFGG